MSQRHQESTAELYVKLAIALADFSALIVFIYLHVSDNNITVAWAIFALLVSILGAMLGQDILRDVRKR